MPVLVSSQKTRINGAYLYNNVYAFSTATASYTGTMKIKLPAVTQNTMLMIRILVYNYATNKSFEVIVSGYAYNKASWINYSAYCSNKNQISRIVLGYEGTNPVILLGTTATKWDYPQVGITDMLAGYSGQSGWGEGYGLSFVTTETGITGMVTPTVNSGLDADTLDGHHASAFAMASHGNHVPAIQTANNKVFLRNDNTWQPVTPANIGAEPAFTKNNAFNKNFGTAAGTVCQGNDARLTDARTPKAHTHTKSQITDFPTSMPASDVYAWAKASTKPSYAWNEIGSKPSTFTPSAHTHDDRYYTEAEVDAKITGATGNTVNVGTTTPSNPKKNDIWI